MDAITVVNVYKSPSAQLTALPVFAIQLYMQVTSTVNTKTGAATTPQRMVKSSLIGLLLTTSHCFLTTSSLVLFAHLLAIVSPIQFLLLSVPTRANLFLAQQSATFSLGLNTDLLLLAIQR